VVQVELVATDHLFKAKAQAAVVLLNQPLSQQ